MARNIPYSLRNRNNLARLCPKRHPVCPQQKYVIIFPISKRRYEYVDMETCHDYRGRCCDRAHARHFWRQEIAAPRTGAAVSGLGYVPQLRTIRRYFASKTSGIPCHSFMPAQLFAFAGTWIDLRLRQPSNTFFDASRRSPRIVTDFSPLQFLKTHH